MINYKGYLVFLFAFLAVCIGLQFVLPFPYGMGSALEFFIVFPLILRKRMMSRMRGGSGGTGSGFSFGGLFGQGQGTGVRYSCLTCNHRFKGGDCPRCGSKMKRADF